MRYKDCFDKERRDFLGAVKRSGIALGAIQASSMLAGVLMARVAEAQTGPGKSVAVFMPGGCTPAKFFPTGSTLPIQTAPLQSHYAAGRIALLKNATMMNGGHGVMFNRFNDPNPWGKQSFDVNLGKTLSANSNAPVKWLNLGTTPVSELSRDSNGIPTITSPQAALDVLFAGGTGGGGGGAVAPRKSLVDVHFKAVNELKTKLGQHEKDKLDSHFNAIRELESTISSTNTGGSCPTISNTSAVGFDATSRLMTDIAVLALSCNLSYSVSLAFGTDEHTHVLDGAMIKNTQGVYTPRPSHDSHHNQGNPSYAGYYDQDVTYYMSLTQQLLDKLLAKGLMDSTVVTQVSDMGNVDAHGGQNCPMLVAGGGVRGGVIDVGGLSQVNLFQTVGVRLKANQGTNGSLFRNWSGTTISGLF